MRALVVGSLIVLYVSIACSAKDGSSSDDDSPGDGAEPLPPGGQCPDYIKFTFVEGSNISLGWTGLSHGTSFTRDAFVRVKVTECEEDCENCAFEGPVRDPTVTTQRCVGDTSIVCEDNSDCPPFECRNLDPGNPELGKVCAHNGQLCLDDEDCGPSTCAFFLGPLFPLFQGAVTCAGTFFAPSEPGDDLPPVMGRISTRTGDVEFERFLLNIGTTDFSTPGKCAWCVGDKTANDGEADGLCQSADAAVGDPSFPYEAEVDGEPQSCDAHGQRSFNNRAAEYSLDCTQPLGVALNVGFAGGSSQGVRRRLTDQQPRCGPGKEELCWCGVCSEAEQACWTDNDCPSGEQCVADDYVASGELPPDPETGADVVVRSLPNACGTRCEVEEGEIGGSCLLAGTETTIGCFPKGEGTVIDVPGKAERRSQHSFRVKYGAISCRKPARYSVPGPVGVQTDLSIGLPGLQVNSLSFIVNFQYD